MANVQAGPPMELVAARTFLDVTNVMIVSIGGREQYRVRYVQVPDAESCAPIVLPQRIRIWVAHYYHPDTWRPVGSWGRTIHSMGSKDDETIRDVARTVESHE
jgi:methyl coenzyme M reductase gamma subunit